MSGHPLLAELEEHGAIAYRRGDKLHLRPAEVIPATLIERLRERKDEILPLLPERPPEPPKAAVVEAEHCLDCGVRLLDGVQVGLCLSCRLARNRETGVFDPPSPVYWPEPGEFVADEPFHIVMERNEPIAEPIQLNRWTLIRDPATCIEADLKSLKRVVGAMNAHLRGDYRRFQEAAEDADDLCARLRVGGCTAWVTTIA